MAPSVGMDSALTQGFKILFNILSPWDEPQSRLYWSHLLVTLLVILVWSLTRSRIYRLWQQKNYTKLWSYFRRLLFAKNYWWHPSARQDYVLFLLNGLLKSLFLSWNLGLSFYIARFTWSALELLWPSPHLVISSVPLFMFTLLAFAFDDFLRFFHHYLSHKLPWLWYLHRVHHSAEVLTPITLFRTHPLESLMGGFRNGLSQG
ncbi:MAG: sterol desaturase family protein, partial [Bdellovibrionaceae bacterium]|nr:sterol desaturase family protein [Pseudobdellovibrionaceae bacterium]